MVRSGAVYVVVSGPPASGKSTLAPPIAAGLELPLLAKDTVKDALMSVLPVPDVEASRLLSRAAVATMLAVAAEAPSGAVLEGNFHRSVALVALRRLPGPIVEVFCRCERAVAVARYEARTGSRHAGHFDAVRSTDDLWSEDVSEPVAGGWPVLEIDTSHPVDAGAVIAEVRALTAAVVRRR